MRESSLLPGTILEDDFRVKNVKKYLPVSKAEGRKAALVMFYDQHSGGLHTVRARDIMSFSR